VTEGLVFKGHLEGEYMLAWFHVFAYGCWMCYNRLIPSVSYSICDLWIVEYSKIEIVHGKVCTRNYDGRIYKSKIKDLDSNDLSLDNSSMMFVWSM
jgi:hypothetical protein